jgi:2-dehydropantoate 2-reductase
MKIGVVGCGALGSFYGARLCHAGHQVHFLLRSDFDVVRRHGVRIFSPDGDLHVRPPCALDPAQIGPCDVVLIGLKTTANGEFTRLLPLLVGSHTRVVTLQNGLGNVEQLAALFGPERIHGGLCFVCLNRTSPGVVEHTAHGLVVLGEFQRAPGRDSEVLAKAFTDAGVPCRLTPNLERAHWEKLVWNVPFNGLGVAGLAGYDAVLAGELGGRRVHGPGLATDALMDEVIGAANARGLGVDPAQADEQIERTRCMGAYRASTLIDFERRLPIELESLFLEPRRRAEASGVSVPRLAALGRVLGQLDALRLINT